MAKRRTHYRTVYITEYDGTIDVVFIDTKKKIRKLSGRYPDEDYTMRINDELYDALKTGTAVVLYDEAGKPTPKSVRLGDSDCHWLAPNADGYRDEYGSGIENAKFGKSIVV